MKKITLNVDHLAVEAFTTGAPAPARGTVAANEVTSSGNTCVYHCTFAGATCDNGCPLTFACPKTYNC